MKIQSVISFCCIIVIASNLSAVTSTITEYRTAAQFAAGDPNGVVINSRGTISLNRDSKVIADDFEDVWTINAIITDGGNTFAGTSPNAAIYRITDNGKEKIYEAALPKPNAKQSADKKQKGKTADPNSPADKADKAAIFANEHVFALALDKEGRLLAGISGRKCRLIRFCKEYKNTEVIFESPKAGYIFAIDKDAEGNLYIATGPSGIIYKISADLSKTQELYKCNERNILSLKVVGGSIYAGSDRRGVLYKIAADGSQASVAYDSMQTDITAITTDADGNVYIAAAISQPNRMEAMQGMQQMNIPPEMIEDGRADDEQDGDDGEDEGDGDGDDPNQEPGQEPSGFAAFDGGLRLSIAAADSSNEEQMPQMQGMPMQRGGQSAVYKISPDGIAYQLAQGSGMFLDMVFEGKELLIAADDKARIISLEPLTRIQGGVYEDPISSQATALCANGAGVIVGLSNPARLLHLKNQYTGEGYWQSKMIDAGQPAKWGKLHLDAQIPEGCSISYSVRSGNINDEKDAQMSPWSSPLAVEDALNIDCPTARYIQLRIILNGQNNKTPVIRGITVASVIPNIAPVVRGIKIFAPDKRRQKGLYAINVAATDENNDKLVYKFELRNIKSSRWIEIEDETERNVYQFNANSVPDGIYEIKVTASDKYANNPLTALEASWISEPVVIDNTAPVIEEKSIEVNDNAITVKLALADEYSVIQSIKYTVNSNEKWNSLTPDDMIYDSKKESFTIVLNDLSKGEHIIAVEITDANENTRYESFFAEIK